MFEKPFKVKSQVVLRGSDKKKLQQKIKDQFKCENVIIGKEEIRKLKVFFNNGDSTFIYCNKENPIFFEADEKLYPSVYQLWQFYNIVPRLKTQIYVIEILRGGAGLFLPGIIKDQKDTIEFEKGDAVSVTTNGCKWPLAVGTSLLSSHLIYFGEERGGKAVNVLHVFGDHLWRLGQKTSPPKEEIESFQESEEDPEAKVADVSRLCIKEIDEKEEMDDLLYNCFMTALKTKLTDKNVPVLTSNFYRNGVLSCCPEHQSLDIKKSSYKKFGIFLKAMMEKGLLEVTETSKGREEIVSINRSHELYRGYKVEDTSQASSSIQSTEIQFGVLVQNEYCPPEISTLYRITSDVFGLFEGCGVLKNSSLPMSEVRSHVTKYVENNELNKGSEVCMDPILHRAVCTSSEGHIVRLPWNELFKRLFNRLNIDHQMKFPGIKPIIGKGEPPKIEINTQKKINNKKVTLVKNLEKFLIDPKDFGARIKKLAQASLVIFDAVESKSSSKLPPKIVQIQGNQVHNVEKILVENYKIPRKYLVGLEKAPKKKK